MPSGTLSDIFLCAGDVLCALSKMERFGVVNARHSASLGA